MPSFLSRSVFSNAGSVCIAFFVTESPVVFDKKSEPIFCVSYENISYSGKFCNISIDVVVLIEAYV